MTRVFWYHNYLHYSFLDGHNTINVPFPLFVLVIPGWTRLPKFKVDVIYHGKSKKCKTVFIRQKKRMIKILCHRILRGRSVKITALTRGRLSLCEVAIFGNYG